MYDFARTTLANQQLDKKEPVGKFLQEVVKDKSFAIQTPVTIQIRYLVVHLLEWCSNNL